MGVEVTVCVKVGVSVGVRVGVNVGVGVAVGQDVLVPDWTWYVPGPTPS